ncbi:MAG: hypothetical protein ACFFD5_15010 [Candidatus Thorarchaeota archaeon]
MDSKIENNVQYYEFLNFVQEISKKAKSIQNNSIKVVFQNFGFRNRIEKQIAELDKRLSK